MQFSLHAPQKMSAFTGSIFSKTPLTKMSDNTPAQTQKRSPSPVSSPADAKRARKEEKAQTALKKIKEEDIPATRKVIDQLAADFSPAALAKAVVFLTAGYQAIGEGTAMDEVRDVLNGDSLPQGAKAPLRISEAVFDEMWAVIRPARVNIHPSIVLNVDTNPEEVVFDEDDENAEQRDFFELYAPASERDEE